MLFRNWSWHKNMGGQVFSRWVRFLYCTLKITLHNAPCVILHLKNLVSRGYALINKVLSELIKWIPRSITVKVLFRSVPFFSYPRSVVIEQWNLGMHQVRTTMSSHMTHYTAHSIITLCKVSAIQAFHLQTIKSFGKIRSILSPYFG